MAACDVENCNEPAKSYGFCQRHYDSWRRRGDPLKAKEKRKGSELIIEGDYAKIGLGHGKYAIIDLEDVEEVRKYIWRCISTDYAHSHQLNLLLHQFLLGATPEGHVVDHINRNKLDCRRANLRFVTHSQNILNSTWHDEAEGITYIIRGNKTRWQAYYIKQRSKIHIGTFDTKEEARVAREAYLANLGQ